MITIIRDEYGEEKPRPVVYVISCTNPKCKVRFTFEELDWDLYMDPETGNGWCVIYCPKCGERLKTRSAERYFN